MYLQVDNNVSQGEVILYEIMNSLDSNVTLSTPFSDNTLYLKKNPKHCLYNSLDLTYNYHFNGINFLVHQDIKMWAISWYSINVPIINK